MLYNYTNNYIYQVINEVERKSLGCWQDSPHSVDGSLSPKLKKTFFFVTDDKLVRLYLVNFILASLIFENMVKGSSLSSPPHSEILD